MWLDLYSLWNNYCKVIHTKINDFTSNLETTSFVRIVGYSGDTYFFFVFFLWKFFEAVYSCFEGGF